MNVDLGIWSKLTRVVIFLFVVALLVMIAQWYLPLIHKNEAMRKDLLQLDDKIQAEQDTARRLKADFDALHGDPRVVERLAREKLRYSKAGETVIVFEDAGSSPAVLR